MKKNLKSIIYYIRKLISILKYDPYEKDEDIDIKNKNKDIIETNDDISSNDEKIITRPIYDEGEKIPDIPLTHGFLKRVLHKQQFYLKIASKTNVPLIDNEEL